MKTLLKWIGVILGSIISGYIAFHLVGWFININLRQWIEPYPILPSKVVGSFVFSITVVTTTYRLAPSFKKTVAIMMGIILIIIGIVGYVLSYNETQIGSRIFALKVGGVAIITSVIGAIAGIILVSSNLEKQN